MKKQVIFITGTSSGLGKAMAELCYENGHIVYGSSRNPPAENPYFKELKVDVTNQQSVQNAVNYILEKENLILYYYNLIYPHCSHTRSEVILNQLAIERINKISDVYPRKFLLC